MSKIKTYKSYKSAFIKEYKLPRKGLSRDAYREREKLIRLVYSFEINCPYNGDIRIPVYNISTLGMMTNLVMTASHNDKYIIMLFKQFIKKYFSTDMLYNNKFDYRHKYLFIMYRLMAYCNINSNLQSQINHIMGV